MPRATGPSPYLIVVSTVFFILVILALGGLTTNVITTMRTSADRMDDQRAMRAAQAAVRSLKDRVVSAARDNAEADDAYEASVHGTIGDWAQIHWGKAISTRPLYDGAVVTERNGGVLMATYKGVSFDPSDRFGSNLREQAMAVVRDATAPPVDFVKTADGLDILASAAIHPRTYQSQEPPRTVLTLYRHLRDADVGLVAEQYQLDGLRFYAAPPHNILSLPLRDRAGNVVAYLGWNRARPGTQVYRMVNAKIVAAGGILIIFIGTITFAGGAESRRMGRAATLARYEATHDALSGLLNRAGLLEDLQKQLTLGNEIQLHLLDLDGFKGVNDAWGHQVGDRLIKKVSDKLVDCHPQILSAARLGGDEFAVVQDKNGSATAIAEAILSVFQNPFEIDGRIVEVGASLGIAASLGVEDAFELLRRADMALYRAKADGKGKAVTYQPQLDLERAKLASLEADLRTGLASGEVRVVYQPLVNAVTGRLSGVEALARWSTAHGPVSPEIFIPVAERSGLIDELGLHVLRQAVRDAGQWPTLTLSVNVSPVQICNPSFATSVSRLLQEERFEPGNLTLEITEGVLMSNPEQARRAIDKLRETGVRFSLDDFGCGYASIGALRQFGFDSMKIDRSLIVAADSQAGHDVLKATVALATALSIPVTAEGIETTTQAELVRDAGCDQLQGYLLGRPMTAEDLSGLYIGGTHGR